LIVLGHAELISLTELGHLFRPAIAAGDYFRQFDLNAVNVGLSMTIPFEEHIDAETLEGYSLGKLDSKTLEASECHLLICNLCRERIVDIEPFNSVHYTADGLFYSRVTVLRDGSLWAHHWGCQIDGGRHHRHLTNARKYLRDSFVQMFPEHRCVEGCVT
jgi:hypothetical protein